MAPIEDIQAHMIDELREQLRQSHQLVAEYKKTLDRYGLAHMTGCDADTSDGNPPGRCTCGRDQKLAALRDRAAKIGATK